MIPVSIFVPIDIIPPGFDCGRDNTMLLWKAVVVAGLVLVVGCESGNGVFDSGAGGDEGIPGVDVIVPDAAAGDDSFVGGDSSAGDDAEVDDTVVPADVAGEYPGVGQDSYVATGLYAVEPDVARCQAGEVSEQEKQKVLDRVNFIRSLHGLDPVEYNPAGDEQTAQCALIISANRKLSHTPDTGWTCWSQDAYDGCNSSNIYIQWGRARDEFASETIVDGFMTDEGVETLGHRRWLIDPWLADISFGRVDRTSPDQYRNTTGAAIQVIGGAQQNIGSSGIEFVAYPFEDYPAELYSGDVMMSLTVIADASAKYRNEDVGFSSASISVIGPGGIALAIGDVQYDNDWYAVPNNLRWYVQGVKSGVTYDVTVSRRQGKRRLQNVFVVVQAELEPPAHFISPAADSADGWRSILI